MTAKHNSFPAWLKQVWPSGEGAERVAALLGELHLSTVCLDALCPNRGECWGRGTATFMILGAVCTRNCAFCGVRHGTPDHPDLNEPDRLAEAAARLALSHVVVTSVTRDDLPDGGAGLFAQVIRALRKRCAGATVEVLTPDFGGNPEAVAVAADAGPDVFAHNVETVPRLHRRLRDDRASYERSLAVLRAARTRLHAEACVKSGLMVGCGETESEVRETLCDLRAAGCDAVTIGQYLKPRKGCVEVAALLPPEAFAAYGRMARELGFPWVQSAPFVRSSYRAERLPQLRRRATAGTAAGEARHER